MDTIATVEIGGKIVVTDNGNPVCNFSVNRGESVAVGKRLILHASSENSDSDYTAITFTFRSIMLGVVPSSNVGHIYFLQADEGGLVFAPAVPVSITPTGALLIKPVGTVGQLDNMEIGGNAPQDGKFHDLKATRYFACNGSTPAPAFTVNAAATDLASAIALLNQIRAGLRSNGQAA